MYCALTGLPGIWQPDMFQCADSLVCAGEYLSLSPCPCLNLSTRALITVCGRMCMRLCLCLLLRSLLYVLAPVSE